VSNSDQTLCCLLGILSRTVYLKEETMATPAADHYKKAEAHDEQAATPA